MMKRHILTTFATTFFAAACASSIGQAADLSYKANVASAAAAAQMPANWSGLYLSGYGLYGANLTNTNIVDNMGLGISTDLASAPHGPGLGGAIGYNYQFVPNGIVIGVRGDIAYANMQGGGNASAPLTGATLSVTNATNYLGDLDAIVGLPLSQNGRLLGYLGGGFAFGGAKPNLQVATLAAAASDTSTGWNVLAGLAYQITPNWQVFMEGDYFQLGDKSLTTTFNNVPVATSLTKYHIFEQKLGVSFKF
jgi:opacity protein-like surface antigen